NVINTLAATVPFIENRWTQRRRRGDFVKNRLQADRLNTRITVVLLAISSALLGTAHVWGQPITCWTPAQFQPHWSVFVDQFKSRRFCYTHGTYFVPFEADLTQNTDERRKYEINYYQWVPYILAVQAVLFCIPHLLRKFINSYLEYDTSSVIQHVEEFWLGIKVQPDLPYRLSSFENGPAIFVWEGLRSRRRRLLNLSRFHALATIAQAVIACLMRSNEQFSWMNYLLGGPAVLLDVISGRDWQETGHFPRTVHCDFQRRALASSQLETVLCMLHLNLYYEKVLMFLWFATFHPYAFRCSRFFSVDLHWGNNRLDGRLIFHF
ncbi:hypothetical protein PMAYCL1PPCAC_03068, partial [Pristionchus mayeri]